MPRLSLIMSTYNDAPYLPLALDSLLNQSYRDFELILIDDGASDETPEIAARYSDDKRLKYHRNPQNLGLTHSLNRGLALAEGELIGRMDADDIATPSTRLAEQVAFLDSQPQIGMLSGDMLSIGAKQAHYGLAGTHAFLQWRLLWQNPISHITVMMRRAILEDQPYDPKFNNAEDYDLWARLAEHTHFYRAENIWAQRRVLASSVSHSRLDRQMTLTQIIMLREQKKRLGFAASEAVMESLMSLIYAYGERIAPQECTDFLLAAYQHYCAQTQLSPTEEKLIQGDMVVWLYRLASRSQSIYPLQKLRLVSPKNFYSRQTIGQIWSILRKK